MADDEILHTFEVRPGLVVDLVMNSELIDTVAAGPNDPPLLLPEPKWRFRRTNP